jgi:hypothetical protein
LVNGIQRTKATSAGIDYLRLLFQLAKLAAHRPGPRAAPPSHPTATGGAQLPPFADPTEGGFAKQKLLQN